MKKFFCHLQLGNAHRGRTRGVVFGLALCLAAWSLAPRSQAETGVTNTINGLTTNYSSGYTVGTNGPFNALIVTNAGVLNVTGVGIIGDSSSANSNNVWVTGTGSVWSNSSFLIVGSEGSSNSLTIANGGTVFDTASFIGNSASSSNNAVLVTGAGSVWSNSNGLVVGADGSGNNLTISNSGKVFNSSMGIIGGNASSTPSSNNTVLVTGAGSVWSNSSTLYVGCYGSVNSLTIASGGTVFNADGYIGNYSTADNNSVIVTGAGSVWSNSGVLHVGYSGSGNSLTITNSGTVYSAGGYIGNNSGANNNAVTVTGTGSVWNDSGDLYVGNSGAGNTLTITNGGQVLNNNGYIGYNTSASNNSVLVTGAGSVWSNSGNLYVGYNGSSNTLTNANGGQVTSGSGSIGNAAGANNNSVLVSDSGSIWNDSGNLFVGVSGSDNSLTIANSGQVLAANSSIGDGAGASNNTVLVTGPGSVWTNSSYLGIGNAGSGNSLTITNVGQVFNGHGYIGYQASASNNLVLVTGAGSVWNNNRDLYVGYNGSSNSLTIGNGGQVFNGYGYIGSQAGASNNSVLVTGAGSVWNNGLDLYVGATGSFNQLTISNGGQVFNANGYIGSDSNSFNNTVTVTDAGSLWSNIGDVFLGASGSSNSLTISNGGQVFGNNAYIGNNIGASNNSVLVTGAGSLWNNSGDLYIGATGSFNQLTISNSGQVFNANGYIGSDSNSFNNTVTVTGTGSVWNNSGNLYVGNYGSSNSLTIANGGVVINGSGYVGYDGSLGGANGNSVLVTGSGSLWSNASDVILGDYNGTGPTYSSGNSLTVTNGGMVLAGGNLGVGGYGSSNTMTIASGGQVFNGNGYIGYQASANNNTVTVTGAGSVWNNNGDLYVGYYGGSNSLTIANGGQVFNNYGYIGYDGSLGGAIGNSVLVTGSGSLWSNASDVVLGDWNGNGPPNSDGNSLTVTNGGVVLIGGDLYVGCYGSSNTLTIASGGQVFNGYGFIGCSSYSYGGVGNSVLVTGSGSLWSNAYDVYIGDVDGYGPPNADGNSLTVTNGARVLIGGDLYVGYYGSSNTMTIASGGQVFNNYGFIGYDGSLGGAGNSVLVTGSGSLWSNAYDVILGDYDGYGPPNSDRNSLTVTNGGMVISGGDLYVGYYGSSNSMTIASGGQVFNNYGYIGYDGNLGGIGNSVLVTGSGSLWSNAYDVMVGAYNGSSGNSLTVTNGGMVVAGGDLYVGYYGSGNTMTIANSGQVFNANSYIGYDSTTSGNTVLVTGAGSIWSNSGSLYVGYSGFDNSLTIADSGTVIATNVVIGFNPSTGNAITVSGGFLYATNGTGDGALTVQNGTLTINSGTVMADLFYASNDTNSVVNLNGGTLSVGAAFVSNGVPFQIGDGASAAALVLRSGVSSFANDLVVANNATLSIFNTVNVAGNYMQNATGTLLLNFSGTNLNQFGFLNITGTASLTGMVEVASFGGFVASNGMQATFLTAAGGWTNHFSGVTNLTAVSVSLLYVDANDVAVKWGTPSFTPYAQTPNQSAVANVLNLELNNPRMAPLITYLSGLPTGLLPGAFDSLSPQGLTAMAMVGAGTANTQAGNLQSRFGSLRNGGGGGFNGGLSLFDPSGIMDWVNQQPRFASMLPMEQELAMTKDTLASGIMRRSSDNPWGVFVEGAGQFVGVNANQNASGYHVTSAGLTVGIDRQLLDATAFPHDQIVVGMAMGYANSSSYLANNGRVDVNGAQGTMYGMWFKEGWHAEAAGGGGANIYDTKRQVLGVDANGNTQGRDLQGMLGGGYDWRLDQWTFGPRASVQYTTVDIDGFTESGSLAPLTIGSQSMDSLLTQVGMHVSRQFAVEKTLWIPDLSLGWQHESMDSVTGVNAQFANGSGNIFSSQGVPIGRDAAVVGLGLTVQWSKDLATYITYGTELMRNNYSVQNVSAGVRFSF